MSTVPRPRTRHAIAKVGDIAVGERKICSIPAFGKEIEIGIFNVGGRFVAYRNICPHAGAPVCQGRVCGTTASGKVGEYTLEREGEILRCPWHGWEFDLLTGEHLVDEKMKLRAYDIETQPTHETLESIDVETEGETILLLI